MASTGMGTSSELKTAKSVSEHKPYNPSYTLKQLLNQTEKTIEAKNGFLREFRLEIQNTLARPPSSFLTKIYFKAFNWREKIDNLYEQTKSQITKYKINNDHVNKIFPLEITFEEFKPFAHHKNPKKIAWIFIFRNELAQVNDYASLIRFMAAIRLALDIDTTSSAPNPLDKDDGLLLAIKNSCDKAVGRIKADAIMQSLLATYSNRCDTKMHNTLTELTKANESDQKAFSTDIALFKAANQGNYSRNYLGLPQMTIESRERYSFAYPNEFDYSWKIFSELAIHPFETLLSNLKDLEYQLFSFLGEVNYRLLSQEIVSSLPPIFDTEIYKDVEVNVALNEAYPLDRFPPGLLPLISMFTSNAQLRIPRRIEPTLTYTPDNGLRPFIS